jgi:Flp pilus assembly protein TadD
MMKSIASRARQGGPNALILTLLVAAAAAALPGCHVQEVALRTQGQNALAGGNHQTALEKYKKLVEINPTSAQYQYGLGSSYLATGQYHEAELALERAWNLAPNDRNLTSKILDDLAEALYRQDKIQQLTTFLTETTKQYGSTESYLRQAEYLAKAGNLDGARVAYRKAAYFASERNPEPYLEMARFYASINDRQNVVKALKYAHYVAPRNQAVLQRMKQYGVQPGQGQKPPKPELLTD